ncbi:4Fe-4S dicluster domain-containing protein [Vibrio breoganii]|uniref:sulfate reduction electron transfer complex DsrMKJOP subunit DsrO n=1 Tax=Vibrio breoganii TaxID=553239 RepID=UPI000C81ACA6|nr:4Fe-4S dicluster domain-containing protein [Vibrio breoganii]PMK28924.1 (4Fe-4S)-binding protein [Vibrio breoganii]PMM07904.1 (4Fe-4S)-binding protein [Vibrio breoganii]PMM24933.1 (4Fe-4S)-binding protein [Vibrio breoganii]PMM85638.1 (4Fe-4S)-binding protein [Vibrio breoganii]PMO66960.1 (4Fe-4S)-binding protein [Vibrio breoganii]
MADKKLTRRQILKGSFAVAAASVASSAVASTSTKNASSQTKRWGMVIDLRRCVGCQACTVACKFENNSPTAQFRTWVSDIEVGEYPHTRRSFLPRLCNHCENPSCVPVCPTGATFKREDGLVLVDSDKCWGCGSCVTACPYGARFINSETKIADKCTFCAHRLEEGLLPACAETCVGGARVFGDLNDPQSDISKLIAEHDVSVLKPTAATRPNVFYIGLTHSDIANGDIEPNTWLLDLENNIDDLELSFKGAQ